MQDSALQTLVDKNALDELIRTQAMALDTCDWATYRSCFADVIHFDFAEHVERVIGKRIGVVTSPEEWIETSKGVIPGFDSTMHAISGTLHQVKGDEASSRCFITADHFLNDTGGDRSITAAGIYHFDSVRTAQGWKIARLRLQVLYYRGNPALYLRAADRVREGRAQRS